MDTHTHTLHTHTHTHTPHTTSALFHMTHHRHLDIFDLVRGDDEREMATKLGLVSCTVHCTYVTLQIVSVFLLSHYLLEASVASPSSLMPSLPPPPPPSCHPHLLLPHAIPTPYPSPSSLMPPLPPPPPPSCHPYPLPLLPHATPTPPPSCYPHLLLPHAIPAPLSPCSLTWRPPASLVLQMRSFSAHSTAWHMTTSGPPWPMLASYQVSHMTIT